MPLVRVRCLYGASSSMPGPHHRGCGNFVVASRPKEADITERRDVNMGALSGVGCQCKRPKYGCSPTTSWRRHGRINPECSLEQGTYGQTEWLRRKKEKKRLHTM